MKIISKIILSLLMGMVIFSCSYQQDTFTVNGEITGLQDAELYFWTPVGGHGKIDTITVREGKFVYESPQDESGWYILFFQNMSEQVIFAEPGLTVDLSADATHLRNMEIKGGEANKSMSEFRKQLSTDMPAEAVRPLAKEFIEKNPKSIVSVYLFQKYFVQQEGIDSGQFSSLFEILEKAQPENSMLTSLKSIINTSQKIKVGQKAVNFQVRDLQGKVQDLNQYKDSTLLLCFWATWEQDSRDDLILLKNVQKEWKQMVSVITLSLDLMRVSSRSLLRIDSVPGHHVCDLNAWESPIVKSYGITELPTYILIDKNQKIIARENALQKISTHLK